jgi:type II secretory pathway component PulF
LRKQLASGCTFTEALRQLGSWLPEFDISLVHAGEQSGRLDACLRLLAEYYNDRARIAQQVISDLLYPAFLLHFGVLIFGFIRWISGTGWDFARATLGVLIPIYAVTGLLIFTFQSKHSERWRAWLEALIQPVPVLGTARRYLAVARVSAALEALLSAGVTIIEAWELAAAASGSPALHRRVLAWRPLLDAGQTPAEALRSSGAFPEIFTSQYSTGEISGKLDETLRRLHEYYQDEGTRKLHIVAAWAPRAIYLCIVLLIAYRIVQFYVGYFHNIANIGGF